MTCSRCGKEMVKSEVAADQWRCSCGLRSNGVQTDKHADIRREYAELEASGDRMTNLEAAVPGLLDEVDKLKFACQTMKNEINVQANARIKAEQENESLRKQVEFNRKYGIHSNAMKEIERLRKALEYIAGVPHDWSESYDQAYKTCVKVAVKALEGGTE